MTCIAPSVVLVDVAAADVGRIAEAIISVHYLRHVGRVGFFPLPPGVDFLDIAHGFGNTSLYAAYLLAHHPKLSVSQVLQLSSEGLVKIPDLATTLAPPFRSEFYEIKPHSPSGLAAGNVKVAFVHALYQSFGLPYGPGVSWSPDQRIRLFEGRLFGIEVLVQFHFFRIQPGLVVYEICAEGRARELSNAEIAAIIALVMLALLAIVATDGAALIPALALL